MKGLHEQVEAIRTNEPLIRTPSIKNTLKAAVVRHKYNVIHVSGTGAVFLLGKDVSLNSF